MSPQTAENLAVLLRGAILSWRERTVTAFLASARPWTRKHWTAYGNTMRKARIDTFPMPRALFRLALRLVPNREALLFIVDESLVRRYGSWVAGFGIHRGAGRSSKSRVVTTPGHKWVTLALGLRLDHCRTLALPIFSALYTCKKMPMRNNACRLYRRHRTVGELTLILVRLVAGWAENRPFFLVGDGAYGTHELADALSIHAKHPTLRRGKLVSRLHKEAALYGEPHCQGRGRPPVVGERRPSPHACAERRRAKWKRILVSWYGGARKTVLLLWGEGLWYKCGASATRIKWVMVRDPEGKKTDEVFFTTDRRLAPKQIVGMFVSRWSLETTYQEVRRLLGLETMRNWSRTAIMRSVPMLLGLYSLLVVRYFHGYRKSAKVRRGAAWYRKAHLTFSDVVVMARREVLEEGLSLVSSRNAREFLIGQAAKDTGNGVSSFFRRAA